MQLNKDILVMGITNRTLDSFYDGGKFFQMDDCLKQIEKMVSEGADIIDVGGESTRPGSVTVTVEEEINRVVPVIAEIKKRFSVLISVDTQKAEVARQAVAAGAGFINDVSAFSSDEEMVKVAAQSQTLVCLMHMQGKPADMQDNPVYQDVVSEIKQYLKERAQFAIDNGVKPDKIIIDPGIGFGKTLEHNLSILKNLDKFKDLGYPVLIGASRKSFIGAISGAEAADRLPGSLAVASLAVREGVNIIRTHDVKETRQAVKMAMSLL